MKITKQQLKKLIKEELEVLSEAGQSVSVDLTQEEANFILLGLEELEVIGWGDLATNKLLYKKLLDAGIGSGFGEEPTEEPTQRKGIGNKSYEDTLAAYNNPETKGFFN